MASVRREDQSVMKEAKTVNRRVFLLATSAVAAGARASGSTAPDMGRMLITGFRGTKAGDPEVDEVRRMLRANQCAGVILLRRNCTSPEQLSHLTNALREAAGDLPPVISVDQEGGKVARLDGRNGFQDWRSAAEVASLGQSDSELLDYWSHRANELAAVGINVNFGPVVDLNVNPRSPIIGGIGRSFGADPVRVSHLAGLFVRAHRQAGVRTSLKHFPGHGSSVSDSHKATADVTATWAADELKPFRALVRAGLADSVMNAHLLHPDFSDAPGVPASLSLRSVDAIRKGLGFDGAIFTDDLQMAAVEYAMPFDAAAVAAVFAGNTFIVYSNYRKADTIATVGHALVALQGNLPLLDRGSLAKQIASADAFRARLT